MNGPWFTRRGPQRFVPLASRRWPVTALAAAIGVSPLTGQEPAGGLTLVTAEGRRPLETASVQGGEVIALDDLAALFQLDIGEDTGERTLTVNAGAGPIVLTAGQPLASVNGQLVSLDAPARRVGGRWFVPLDFVSRVLARIHDQRLELRGRSRLLLVGEVRVPRVSAQLPLEGTVRAADPADYSQHRARGDRGSRSPPHSLRCRRHRRRAPRGTARGGGARHRGARRASGIRDRAGPVLRLASHRERRVGQLDATGGRPGGGGARGRGGPAGGAGEPASGSRRGRCGSGPRLQRPHGDSHDRDRPGSRRRRRRRARARGNVGEGRHPERGATSADAAGTSSGCPGHPDSHGRHRRRPRSTCSHREQRSRGSLHQSARQLGAARRRHRRRGVLPQHRRVTARRGPANSPTGTAATCRCRAAASARST